MIKLLTLALLVPCVSIALPVKKGENFKVQIHGEYIIKSNGEKSIMNVKRVLGKNLFLVKANSIKSLSMFEHASPNYAYYGEYKDVMKSTKNPNTPNDADFSSQFHHQMIKTTSAWGVTKGSKEIVIAVTDNEFQLDHTDLQTTWYKNKNEIPDNGIDDDNNGYIDDVTGYDFIGQDNDVDSTEEPTHGTHVSGTISATVNNSIGGSGVAPNIRVMPLRWYGIERRWTSAIVAEAYHYAVDNGAKIISTSYNIDFFAEDEVYLDAVQYAKDNDVLIFNSAGNSGELDPKRGSVKDVILVCSVQSADDGDHDIKSRFSNYGKEIDICAPGDPVYAPIQGGSWSTGPQNKYGELSGTSMAAPIAASVAALIWSVNPNFTAADVRQRLYESADNIDAKNSKYIGTLGAGRVNAFTAVK